MIRRTQEKVYLEVFHNENGLVFASKDLGSIHEQPMDFFPISRPGIIWSKNENRVLYTAAKKVVNKHYGEEAKTEEELQETIKSYAFRQTFGERFSFDPVLFVWTS